MYKHASRNLQRSNRIDRPLPTGGYIGLSTATESDFIPTADNMSREEVEAERRQLLLEKVRAENELAAAQRRGEVRAIDGLGHRLAGLAARLGLLKRRIRDLNIQDAVDRDQAQARVLPAVIKEVCSPEVQAAIWARLNEIMAEKG